MKDKELKLNASGYYDEPCYKAITAAPRPGEIWTHNQSGAYMLVVANVNGVCPTLRLNEQQKDGCIPVTCRALMYTNPAFMGYVFETNLAQYVKTVKEDEFKAVRQGLADMLGITSAEDYYNGLKIKDAAMLEEYQTREKLIAEYDELLDESFEKVSREADKAEIYKEMYMTLLDKVISARGGSVNE